VGFTLVRGLRARDSPSHARTKAALCPISAEGRLRGRTRPASGRSASLPFRWRRPPSKRGPPQRPSSITGVSPASESRVCRSLTCTDGVSEARHAPYVHDQYRLDRGVFTCCWRCAMSAADRVIGWSTALAVLGAALVAAVVSYEHARDLIRRWRGGCSVWVSRPSSGRRARWVRGASSCPLNWPAGEVVIEGENHGGGAVTQPKFGEDMVDVGLDRPLAHKQRAGDLGVVLPAANQG
jgi:hypothetical protein